MALELDISKLAWKTDEKTLRVLFGSFGLVTACKVARDWETGRSRRRAKVTFAHPHEGQAAMEALQGAEIDGEQIAVALAPGQTLPAPAPARAQAPAGDEAPVADEASEDAGDRAARLTREEREEARRSKAPKRGGIGGLLGGGGGGGSGPDEDESQTFG